MGSSLGRVFILPFMMRDSENAEYQGGVVTVDNKGGIK